MATTKEITEVLTRLIAAYPTSKIDNREETIRVYAESLEDIPGYVLEKAMEECIKLMKWFPSISELRKEASRIAGIGETWMGKYSEGDFRSVPEKPFDYLADEYNELVRLYCQRPRQFDEDRWLNLVGRLERMGRDSKAHQVQLRLDAFKWTVENEHTPMFAEEYAEKRAAYAITEERQTEYPIDY